MRIQKGGYGYINNRKRKALTGVLLMAAAGIAVFVLKRGDYCEKVYCNISLPFCRQTSL